MTDYFCKLERQYGPINPHFLEQLKNYKKKSDVIDDHSCRRDSLNIIRRAYSLAAEIEDMPSGKDELLEKILKNVEDDFLFISSLKRQESQAAQR